MQLIKKPLGNRDTVLLHIQCYIHMNMDKQIPNEINRNLQDVKTINEHIEVKKPNQGMSYI